MKKRSLVIISVCFTLVFNSFVGCTGNDVQNNNKSGGTHNNTSEEVEFEEIPTTIAVYAISEVVTQPATTTKALGYTASLNTPVTKNQTTTTTAVTKATTKVSTAITTTLNTGTVQNSSTVSNFGDGVQWINFGTPSEGENDSNEGSYSYTENYQETIPITTQEYSNEDYGYNVIIEPSSENVQNQSTDWNTDIYGIQELPDSIMNVVNNCRSRYPGMNIGVGIYSLDGTRGFEYNAYQEMSSACTVKAPYAWYVLQRCERENIDIENTYLTYEYGMRNNGSGEIKNIGTYGDQYSIKYLLTVLLGISDNTAYNILLSRFSLGDYQAFINQVGGQNMKGVNYGSASVAQRKNEWVALYNYINSGSYYSETLRQLLSQTQYCYLVEGMYFYHSYLHKSGWADGPDYTSAADCAIVDYNYLLIVITEDRSTGVGHTDVLRTIGDEVETYANNKGGLIF